MVLGSTRCSMQRVDRECNLIQINKMDWVYALGPAASAMKGHSQTVADMNFQMHQITEASFPSSLITTSGFDSICVIKVLSKEACYQWRLCLIHVWPWGRRVILKKLSSFHMSVLMWISKQDLNSYTGTKLNNKKKLRKSREKRCFLFWLIIDRDWPCTKSIMRRQV